MNGARRSSLDDRRRPERINGEDQQLEQGPMAMETRHQTTEVLFRPQPPRFAKLGPRKPQLLRSFYGEWSAAV